MKRLRNVAFALAATFLSGAVGAEIITFQSFPAGTYDSRTTFFEAGYTLVYKPVDPNGPGVFPYGFAEIGEPQVNIACAPTACSSDGTNAFYSFNAGSLTISATDGNPISISATPPRRSPSRTGFSTLLSEG